VDPNFGPEPRQAAGAERVRRAAIHEFDPAILDLFQPAENTPLQ
jgi:hypothetical protein